MADEALLDLLSEPTQYRDDLYRNIKTCRDGQHLFDDLTDNASDFDIANKFEALTRIPAAAPTIERPFDDTIEYPFNNLAVTRFSDGSFGVFYGSLELETTISETIYHWLGFLNDSDFLTREMTIPILYIHTITHLLIKLAPIFVSQIEMDLSLDQRVATAPTHQFFVKID